MYFLFKGGPSKNYSDEGGGGRRKKSEIGEGGHTIFKLHSSKFHQPAHPYPIKNERSLNCCGKNDDFDANS